MQPTQEAIVALIQRFVAREKPSISIAITADTELLKGGFLDSLKLVKLVGEIATEFGRPIPKGFLMPDDFDTPAVLWDRLCEIWNLDPSSGK